MSDIKNIQIGSKISQQSKLSKPAVKSDKYFSAELMKTVETLEKMGSEIDQAMETSTIKTPKGIKSGVVNLGKMINNIAEIMEKIATPSDSSSSKAKIRNAAAQYDRMSKKS